MKIALISDLHANNDYLQAVSLSLKSHNPDFLYCLGDLVDYYDAPDRVIDWCIAHQAITLKGNHDKFILGELEPDPANLRFYRLEEQRNVLQSHHYEFLRALPDYIEVSHEGFHFYMTHSLPGDCTSYLRDPAQLDRGFLRNYDFYCFGHTHIPLIQACYGTTLINPGSIGQPRDYTTQPSFAIVDLAQGITSLHRVAVDVEGFCRRMAKEGVDEKMRNILRRDKGYER